MHRYWSINYKLQEHDPYHPGQLVDFDRCRSVYIANVEADTDIEAVKKLKRMYNMLHVQIMTLPVMHEITDAEYDAN